MISYVKLTKTFLIEILLTLTGGEFMPRLILVKQNHQEIIIDCNQLPTSGGGPVTLEIPNVEIRTHTEPGQAPYDYLYIPPGQQAADPANDLRIILRGPVQGNSLILPYNGGYVPQPPPDSQDHVTLKINV